LSENNKINISENHKRSLSVTSRHIENSINEIEELLTNKKTDTLTEKIIKNISEEKRNQILSITKIIREKNQNMFNDLELNSSTFYEDRIIRSRITHIWSLLCDSTSDSLKGYGAVSPSNAELINDHVNSLLETINEIQSIIH